MVSRPVVAVGGIGIGINSSFLYHECCQAFRRPCAAAARRAACWRLRRRATASDDFAGLRRADRRAALGAWPAAGTGLCGAIGSADGISGQRRGWWSREAAGSGEASQPGGWPWSRAPLRLASRRAPAVAFMLLVFYAGEKMLSRLASPPSSRATRKCLHLAWPACTYTGSMTILATLHPQESASHTGIWVTKEGVCKGLGDEEQVSRGNDAQTRKYQLFVFVLYLAWCHLR